MKDRPTFRKIAGWMLSKPGFEDEAIINLAGLSEKQFKIIMDPDADDRFAMTGNFKARVQDFNKKYYEEFLNEQMIKEGYIEADPEIKEKESIAVNQLLYNQDRSEKRTKEKIQEKIFNEQLQRLRDVMPDHMTFDIIIKYK